MYRERWLEIFNSQRNPAFIWHIKPHILYIKKKSRYTKELTENSWWNQPKYWKLFSTKCRILISNSPSTIWIFWKLICFFLIFTLVMEWSPIIDMDIVFKNWMERVRLNYLFFCFIFFPSNAVNLKFTFFFSFSWHCLYRGIIRTVGRKMQVNAKN